MDDKQQFVKLANLINPIIKLAVQQAYKDQGHTLTGNLINSIDGVVSETVNGAQIEYMMLDYGVPTNTGVPAARIPYSPGSGGKFSAYITGLILYARLRFSVPAVEAKKIAFAIAAKHKREGMPTNASRRFSKTGQRTRAIEQGIEDSKEEVNGLIQEALETYITALIVQAFADVTA